MTVEKALLQRHSTRAFLPTAVDEAMIRKILDLAKQAPSGANTQPWQVAVVTGETKKQLSHALTTAFEQGHTANADYPYYPEKWQSPYTERRRACGLQLYQSLEITRSDKAAQKAQWAANYRAFDAPVMLLFFLDEPLLTGSFLDYGLFLQSIMLLAEEMGLATCPQAALADYPEIIKTELGYPFDSTLVCGMALGYADTTAAVNLYRTAREPVDSFTRFFN